MHVETSADARRSQRRGGVGGDCPPGGVVGEQRFFASLINTVKAAVSGHGNSPSPTADIGAGLRGDNDDRVSSGDSDAIYLGVVRYRRFIYVF